MSKAIQLKLPSAADEAIQPKLPSTADKTVFELSSAADKACVAPTTQRLRGT